MNPWIPITGLSAAFGLVTGLACRRLAAAVIIGTVIPWFGMLGFLLYNECCVPYQGGGASMWPIALVVGGTAASMIGAGAAYTVWFVKYFLKPAPAPQRGRDE